MDALVDIEGGQIAVRIPSVATEEQNGDGYVKNEKIGNNHAENPAYLCLVVDDEVKARVENDRLTRDHAIPSDTRQNAEREIGSEAVVAQQNYYGVQDYAQGGGEHAPEVEALVALEAVQQGDEDLDAVVAGHGEEARDDHVDGKRRRDGTRLSCGSHGEEVAAAATRPIMILSTRRGMERGREDVNKSLFLVENKKLGQVYLREAKNPCDRRPCCFAAAASMIGSLALLGSFSVGAIGQSCNPLHAEQASRGKLKVGNPGEGT